MTDLNAVNPDEIDITEIPKPDRADNAHAGAKALFSVVPYIGGSVAELFGFIVTPSITRRRDKLIQAIGYRLVALEQKGIIDFNALRNNEAFVTILLQALQIGMRNHREEKLHALQNIVINSAIELEPDEDLKVHFLNLIDSMTALHLVLFVYWSNPKTWIDNNPDISERLRKEENNPLRRGAMVPMEWIFPELEGQKDFVNTIFEDLDGMNLIERWGSVEADLFIIGDGRGGHSLNTTDFGTKFLKYISTPDGLG